MGISSVYELTIKFVYNHWAYRICFLLGTVSAMVPGFILLAGWLSSSDGIYWSFFTKNSFKSKNNPSSLEVKNVKAVPLFPARPVLPVLCI
jgi:hypothetical protein